MTEQPAKDKQDVAENGPSDADSKAATQPAEKALRMRPWQGLFVGLLAGVVVWAALQSFLPLFSIPAELQELQGPAIASRLEEIQHHNRVARIQNATLALVVLAFTLGFVLAAAELLLRRQPLRAVWGGLLAGIIAGVIAIGAGAAGVAVSDLLRPPANPTVKPAVGPLLRLMLVQSTMLGVLGSGVGLGLSLPMFRPRPLATCLIGCLLGGFLAALLFPPAVGYFLPHANTEDLVPESGSGRLLWVGLFVGLIGVTVTGLGKEQPKREN